MFFPIGDDNVKGGHKPLITYTFLALNIVIFLIQMSVEGNLICSYGSIPANIAGGKDFYTLISSMFLHGGWMHLIGNMLFLWVFGDNIEAVVGNVLFFSIGGESLIECCTICASAIPTANCGNLTPCAGSVPTVGASGAIAACLGAYLVMFPGSQIKVLILIIFRTFRMAALLFLGLWIGQQLLNGFMTIGPESAHTSGVAYWAHIGGFVFGVLMGFLFKKWFPKIDLVSDKPTIVEYKPRRRGF